MASATFVCVRAKILARPLGDPLDVRPTDLLNLFVADVLVANPASARAFIERGMGCVGCTFAPFETVTEAARAYGIEPSDPADSLADAYAHLATPEDHHNDHY